MTENDKKAARTVLDALARAGIKIPSRVVDNTIGRADRRAREKARVACPYACGEFLDTDSQCDGGCV